MMSAKWARGTGIPKIFENAAAAKRSANFFTSSLTAFRLDALPTTAFQESGRGTGCLSRSGQPLVFVFAGAKHQFADGLVGVFAFVED